MLRARLNIADPGVRFVNINPPSPGKIVTISDGASTLQIQFNSMSIYLTNQSQCNGIHTWRITAVFDIRVFLKAWTCVFAHHWPCGIKLARILILACIVYDIQRRNRPTSPFGHASCGAPTKHEIHSDETMPSISCCCIPQRLPVVSRATEIRIFYVNNIPWILTFYR